MNGYLYCGDFILSTNTPAGERFVTLRADNYVMLDPNRNGACVLRMYMGRNQLCVFTTRPMTKNGVENAYDIAFRFNTDASGVGILDTSPDFSNVWIPRSGLGRQGGSDTVNIKDHRLGSTAGRFNPEDRFYLEYSWQTLFPPGPWKFESKGGPPFDKKDQRFLNFNDDTIAIKMTESNIKSSRFQRARLMGCDFTGSQLDNGGFYDAVFGEGGSVAILNNTSWTKGSFNNTNFSGCSLKKADFRDAVFNMPEGFPLLSQV